jgi:hypothetical protein
VPSVSVLWGMARLILGVLPQVVLNPAVGFLYWLVAALVYWQAARAARLERALYGQTLNPPLLRAATAAAFGVLAGVAGSLVIGLVGVPLGEADIISVWPLALLLLLVNPRLLCFAYAGGVLALANLAFGWPPIHVAGLLGLVAVLHLVEGVLVALDHEKVVTPLYVRHRPGQVVGGFLVQRFWPVPLVIVLFLPTVPALTLGHSIPTPAWWPLILTPGVLGGSAAAAADYFLLPVAAVLGYADIALTRPAGQKSARTAALLLIYAVVLLGLAVAGSHYHPLLWLAAIFAPAAHEALARHGGSSEVRGQAVFVPAEDGVRILDVVPGSPAAQLGLASGDVVRSVNGSAVRRRGELWQALDAAGLFLDLEVDGPRGRREIETSRHRGGSVGFGLLTVPEPGDEPHADLTRRRPWLAVVEWLRRVSERLRGSR